VDIDYYKNGPHGKFFCKYHGCKASNQPNCRGFCREHVRTVLDGRAPAPYPLVLPEDRDLITESTVGLGIALEHVVPCHFTSSEKRADFPGLACKHCTGKEGIGKKRKDTTGEGEVKAGGSGEGQEGKRPS